ncbi:hypothetical protein EFM98_07405 [Propionibacterium freudenreichii]|nr:hypothetical protein [Propionibacterium freudenreichii]MCT3000592.1 hypothetical protein [Propionibacterium freudenreichii]
MAAGVSAAPGATAPGVWAGTVVTGAVVCPGTLAAAELADAAPLGDALLADGLELPASPAATFAGDAPKTSTAINTPTTNCTSHDSAKLHQ